jgi:hypothetical protein
MTSKESQWAIDPKGCEAKTPSAKKKKCNKHKKAKGLSILRDTKPKHLRLTKIKEGAKSTYVMVNFEKCSPNHSTPLQIHHLFQVQIVEST